MEKDLSKRFYFKSREVYERKVLTSHLVDKKLEVNVIKKGIVLPAHIIDANDKEKGFNGGVCDENFNFVAGYSRTDPSGSRKGRTAFDVSCSYVVDREKVTYFDEDVIFGGALMGAFGHFILECWTRLWYILEPPPLLH